MMTGPMQNLSLRSLRYAYLIVVLLAIAWAYTSHMYNWLNVGGGEGNVTLWIIAGEVATYSCMVSWLGLLLMTGFSAKSLFPKLLARTVSWTFAICIPVIVFFTAAWFFHLGFPRPPPM